MNTPGKIKLSSGRILYLRELRQWYVYEGMLEGLPTTEGNLRRLNRLVAENRGKPYPGDPFLIRPTERPVPHHGDEPYPFGTPASLPAVACVGRLTSSQPARDQSKDFSGLVVIWFQEEFAFPIDPEILEQIGGIDWESKAIDLEY